MANKRKRDELSDDADTDEITPGKQTLPVANLPYDFDQEPQDGMQYLFLVRRDARRLPHVTRVRNPYEMPEARVTHTSTPPSINVLPCEEWRIAFQTHFSHLRKNLTRATIHVDQDHSRARLRIPEKKDRDAWWKFLAGHPESAWNLRIRSVRKKLSTSCLQVSVDPAEAVPPGCAIGPSDMQTRDESCHPCLEGTPRHIPQWESSRELLRDAESTNVVIERLSPPEVTPSHLWEIDHRMSIHLLMYFTHWINVHLQNPSDPLTAISINHGRWIFALLTKIEDQLSADETNLLRNLARACLGFIRRYGDKHAKNDAVIGGLSNRIPVQDTMRMSDASCWMVFAAVAGHWGQRDLWTDAVVALTDA